MLNHMIIVENYFTLEILNTQLENIELSTKESKSRPTCVSSSTLNSGGSTFKQSG